MTREAHTEALIADVLREQLKDAFITGCSMGLTWAGAGMPQDDLDEAGYDYANVVRVAVNLKDLITHPLASITPEREAVRDMIADAWGAGYETALQSDRDVDQERLCAAAFEYADNRLTGKAETP